MTWTSSPTGQARGTLRLCYVTSNAQAEALAPRQMEGDRCHGASARMADIGRKSWEDPLRKKPPRL
jgi:hypothetical protein